MPGTRKKDQPKTVKKKKKNEAEAILKFKKKQQEEVKVLAQWNKEILVKETFGVVDPK